MIGQLLGHYRIVEKIGAGGMGEVYRAHDETLDRDVAIKVLPIGILADEAARKRFRKEALALAKLNHPNIETVYEFATQDGVDFLAMELIAGLTLSQKLTGGLLTDQETLKLGTQIADGLNAAHERGVVHCDLKPGNVMVMANGHAKVLDFGLAKFLQTSKDPSITESLNETKAAGTLPYMSPEQVRGERVDSRTDIYSAGAVLYEMSTGQRPFPETQGPRLIDAILHQLPMPPSTLNPRVKPSFENVILKALDKDPDRRYQSATELSVDLKRLATSAPFTTAPHRQAMRRFRLPTAISVSVAVLLALAFLGVRNYKISRRAESAPTILSGVPPRSSGRFVAVLPIQVLEGASQIGYLAQGIQEGISTRLFQLKDVSVNSTDEAAKIDQKQPLTKIASSFGANYIVHGALQSSEDKIRVNLNLEDVAQGSRLWSQELSGTKDQLQILDDQASEAIATALGIKASEEELSRSEVRETSNLHAYDLYLRGRYSLVGNDVNSIKSALDYFDQALHEDVFFVLPFIGAADASLRMYAFKKDTTWIQKALSAAQAAQQLDDGLPEVHSVLGSIYTTSGKHAEAVAELKRAISLAPTSDEAYRRLGGAYLASGDYPHAIEAFEKGVGLNSYFWVNQNSLGNAYFQSGDYPKALQAYQQVTVLAPDIETGFENIGNVYAQQGKYQEATTYFKKALQIEPNYTTWNYTSCSNLGTAYFFLKQYAQAVRMFEKAVELDPNDTAMMTNLADAYRGAGQLGKAHATYQRAVSLGYKQLQTNPQDADVMAEIALCYANLGDAQQADNFIKKARAIDKSNVGYIYEEAQIYALLGKTKEALKSLQESLEKRYPAEAVAADPNVDSLRNSPDYYELIKKYSSRKP
jgi:eukaryotic-like serine/threonine-protein kinase